MRRTIDIASGVVVLGASTAIALRGVPRWDAELFSALNRGSDTMQYVLWGPMQLGALGAPLAIGGARFLRGDRPGGVRTIAAGGAAWVGAKAVKKLVGRKRPAAHVPDTALRIGAADTGLGFPSGHAAVAVVVALTGLERMPVDALHPLVPVLVGLGRVHVGAHFPLDVIGGWGLGLVCTGLVDAVAAAIDPGHRRLES